MFRNSMTRTVLGALAMTLLLAPIAGAGEKAKTDHDQFQGTWIVDSAKKSGEDAPKELIDTIKLTVKGDKISLSFGGEVKDGSIKIDATKKPKTIDLNIDDKTIEGIYDLKGDMVTIAATEPGNPRPTEFKSESGTQSMLIVFKRVQEKKEEKKTGQVLYAESFLVIQKDKGEPGGKSDKEKVQGDWVVDSIEKGGQKLPEELTQGIKVTIKGNKISINFGGETKDGSFKVDETKQPKELDLNLDGKESKAIYEISGEKFDKLRILGAEPGQDRPKDFKGKEAMEAILFVFKRPEPEKVEPKKDKKDKVDDKKGKGLIQLPPADDDCCLDDTPLAKAERDQLQGSWTCVAAERAGEKAPADFIKNLRLTIKDEKLTFQLGSPGIKEGVYILDPTKSPKHINMKVEGEGKQGLGIYKLDGDTLTLALTAEDQGRPAAFSPGPGQNATVLVLQRDKEAKVILTALKAQAQRQVSANNLKNIGIAFHSYHDAMGKFPPAAIMSKDGKPLLSWRVALLPYLEQNNLYQQFKLDEPWDSPNNKKLLEKMPAVFGESDQGKFETFYQVFTGPGTIFEGPKGLKITTIVDGTSNTILAIEAGTAVPWTKPDDLPFEPKKDLPKVGGLFKGNFHVLFADASVRFYTGVVNPEMMRGAIRRADGIVVDLDRLTK